MLSLGHVNHVCGVVHDLQQINPLPTPQGVLCWGEEGGVLFRDFQQGGWHLPVRVAPEPPTYEHLLQMLDMLDHCCNDHRCPTSPPYLPETASGEETWARNLVHWGTVQWEMAV